VGDVPVALFPQPQAFLKFIDSFRGKPDELVEFVINLPMKTYPLSVRIVKTSMSLFNTAYPNTIGLRAGTGLFEQLYTVNQATGLMELVQPGGGGVVQLSPRGSNQPPLISTRNLPSNSLLHRVSPHWSKWYSQHWLAEATTHRSHHSEEALPIASDGITIWDSCASKFPVA
jgi:hypothetical protein